MKAIILAGGGGARFWPKSRKNIPKQCLAITSEKTMAEETIDRLSSLFQKKDIYIATGEHLETLLKKVLPDVNYIVEPMPKSTAACIGLSALFIPEDEIMLFETTDHYYPNVKTYLNHLKAGIKMAEQDKIVLIGIKPTFPHTGYGYIKQGMLLENKKIKIYEVSEFKEKPKIETAQQFLVSGEYLWNSGIFIAKASVMLDAIKRNMPALYSALINIKKSRFDKKTLKKEFEKLESVSIDHGVLEKEKNLALVRGEFEWDDVGDWKAMERIFKKDLTGNIILGSCKGTLKDCIIDSDVEAKNINDLIVVSTDDCLLVCSKDASQDVKKVVDILGTDPKLKKYTEDIQKESAFYHLSIDSTNVQVEADCLVATVGVKNLYIKKKGSRTILQNLHENKNK